MFDWFRQRRREREAYLDALQAITASQHKTLEMVMAAVDRITATQAKQVDAISSHLSLFKTTEPPQAYSMAGIAGERAEMEQAGFPFDATPAEQAKWLEAHMDD